MPARIFLDFESCKEYLEIQHYEEHKGQMIEESRLLELVMESCQEIQAKREGDVVSLYFPTNLKIVEEVMEPLLKTKVETKSNSKGNQANNQSKINIIVGPQCLFFELGNIYSHDHEIIVFSNNQNFFQKEFIQRLTKKSKKQGYIDLKQRKVECLFEEIESINLENISLNDQEANTNASESTGVEENKYHKSSEEPNASKISHGPNKVYGYEKSSETNSTLDFDYGKDIKSTLPAFLGKITNYFNKKNEYDMMSFLKVLDNLVTEHLHKLEKKLRMTINKEEKEHYFIYIRDYLCINNITTGESLRQLVMNRSKVSIEELKENNTVKIDTSNIETLISYLKSDRPKSSLKGHKLLYKIEHYASICYSIILNLLSNDFSKSGKPITSVKGLKNTIHHVLKSYYNSKRVKEEHKMIIKNDKRLKYIILNLLKKKGVWEELGQEELTINHTECESFLNDFKLKEMKDILVEITTDIQKMTASQNS
ncbi:unnamed protein product [Moneuplotes crassus]|uniref:Uncharacterized protein n=1 Tax=Euplotes crassus TaxID=5936 RepID=A0AAD1Y5U8_EUPCR|nr:unnamed protein product [Moneuplotes crassus]